VTGELKHQRWRARTGDAKTPEEMAKVDAAWNKHQAKLSAVEAEIAAMEAA
jgi:hypothetical protein